MNIPKVKPNALFRSPADEILDSPSGAYARSVNELRLDLEALVHGETSPVIVVTSETGGEGKSTCALALARSFKASGASPLLIDANLRNPSLADLIGLRVQSGLLGYLASEGEVSPDLFQLDPETGVGVVLGCGAPAGGTEDLLRIDLFADLVSKGRQSYDAVIIDAPALECSDPMVLAGFADVVLQCVGENRPTSPAVSPLRTCLNVVHRDLPICVCKVSGTV